MTEILWLRRDLRRADHPALAAAAAAGPVLPVFVVDPRLWRSVGPARRAWVTANLRSLDEAYDGGLCLRVGDPAEVLPRLARETGAERVHLTRETAPWGVRRDAAVAEALSAADVAGVPSGTPYAVDPGTVLTGSGTPYQVFSPWARAWQQHGWPAPVAVPTDLRLAEAPSDDEARRLLDEALAGDLPALAAAGEEAATERWRTFLDGALAADDEARNVPAVDGTSRMSPYLRLGVVHPRTLLADLAGHSGAAVQRYRLELGWREFYADVLHHHPHSAWADLKPALAALEYDEPGPELAAWCEGRTGFPIVDAGMRQMLAEGWMHNRVRMITASFLTKDLHVWWGHGARHFMLHLCDGDIASNNHGWQWVAGTGTDASPYFRVFNPVTQGLKFDPDGDYVRRWVPELADLPGKAAHEPWKHGGAPGYPDRIVDHAQERAEALRRYEAVRA
ncbi:MAG: Deoxyribodipyrimidine photolyase [uncultured Nocardioides sp.]|uniref:Deoxyribodipyrimidine photolyase n=1 Tax=uncultured Nocardioides sp. TaxID=198441 RepID=A0A6J4P6W5_9ACTN|nr:MAG: Deoxyribodipyrimidine photolyase [uncultured Nocardioides sp.]